MYECAQTFTVDFRFNRIDIEVMSASCYKPSLALIELYENTNFQERTFNDKYYIQFQIPIARTVVLIPPGMDSVWASIAFKRQEPGNYCWLLRNQYDEDTTSLFFVKRKVPKQYAGGFSYMNRWRDDTSDYSSIIYGISPTLEKHLITRGTMESIAGYGITVDAPDANPIIVEGKGTVSHVTNVVRDTSGRAVGIIITGSEIFEQGEIITKTVTFNVHTPENYPVYNAKVMQDGIERGRTDKDGILVAKVEAGLHTYKGEKSISKELLNKTAKQISEFKDIQME